MTRRTIVFSCALLGAVAAMAPGQVTVADYERAQSLPQRYAGLVVGAPDVVRWVDSSDTFWYRRSVAGGHEFVLVDAANPVKRPAFDHARLAAALSAATGRSYGAVTLPFTEFAFGSNRESVTFAADSANWSCALTDYRCTRSATAFGGRGGRGGGGGSGGRAGGPPEAERVTKAPDGSLVAFVANYNVWLRPATAPANSFTNAVAISTDGSEGNPYTFESIAWAPDSKKLAAYRVRPGYRRMVRYVQSSPPDQVQPKTFERFYAKPGDVLDLQQPSLFILHGSAATEVAVDNALFPNPYALSRIEWRHDSRAFTFEYNQRGHQLYRIVEVDAATGAPRAVITETSKTFIDYPRANGGLSDTGHQWRYDVADGKEVIWMSERDGWAHLYLYDGATGAVKNQITKGSWLVRGVVSVDEAKRQITFIAAGVNPTQDPYFAQYYRVNFDGTGLTALTDADGNHSVDFSPDGKYYVDTWSRVDLAPVSQLRRADGGAPVDLEHGDLSALTKTGWRPPEVFVAKGRDGVTDIWGLIYRPTNFDSRHKYPVIENIYAGPQGSFVPKSFQPYNTMQSLAELGFVVVQIDGMGTNNRSRAFHDVAYKNLGDAGFPDRILWHKAVAAKYPWYDITRVGIYGGSAGGQNSLGGMLFHPEFYKVAVSFAGCHDNRMDKVWWNELWMGWPIGPQYAASSNVVNAANLQGKLLLVVGELDTNVDPSSTMQVVNALIKSNKYFDLLVMPNEDHPAGRGGPSKPYGDKKLYDFFVHNLVGVEPPDWNGRTMPARGATGSGDDFWGPSWNEVEASWMTGTLPK